MTTEVRPVSTIPETVAAVAPAPTTSAKPRRVMVFTVHGTFDNEAGWDNWDPAEKRPDGNCRLFINRLSEELRARGVVLDKVDHVQYNWSGGNSHDERRTAAIGLKKRIQEELAFKYKEHGADYYDGGVYVVGHSHGGTISRIAMNLWEKDTKYYDPIFKSTIDEELKHDDTCAVCMRSRNGVVGPNSVKRPDRVFTFGSPFVTFEKRRGSSLLTARLGVWVLRILGLIPLAAVYIYLGYLQAEERKAIATGVQIADDTILDTGVQLLLPLVLYWLLALYLPRLVQSAVDRLVGVGNIHLAVATLSSAIRLVALALVGIYYAAYLIGVWTAGSAGGWNGVIRLFPILETRNLDDKLLWLTPLIVYWLAVVTLPGRYIGWIGREVDALRERLPKKYDPPESDPVAYVNYHTAGDEAGVGLRNFGLITWAIQTLSYAAGAILTVGFALVVVVGVELLLVKAAGGGVLAKLGISALDGVRAHQDRLIQVMDVLTVLPVTFWTLIGGSSEGLVLGKLANKYDLVPHVPSALMGSVVKLLLVTMPMALLALLAATIVSARLRGSGKVFGSERLAWTMANRIGVSRRANSNSMLRNILITPEAWRQGELAHCYYYKSDVVTKDVAEMIADPGRHMADRPWPLEAWTSATVRWTVIVLFVLSIFVTAVPMSAGMETSRLQKIAAEAAKAAAPPTAAPAAAPGATRAPSPTR